MASDDGPMTSATSAGLLVYRQAVDSQIEVLLVHPGGPFWARKDLGAWSIPKGEYTDEDPRDAARREFSEELGLPVPEEPWRDLGSITQKAGKVVTAFAVEADLDLTDWRSNAFEMEWPPRSGRRQSFPEVDRAQWFDLVEARRRLLAAQIALIDRLVHGLSGDD